MYTKIIVSSCLPSVDINSATSLTHSSKSPVQPFCDQTLVPTPVLPTIFQQVNCVCLLRLVAYFSSEFHVNLLLITTLETLAVLECEISCIINRKVFNFLFSKTLKVKHRSLKNFYEGSRNILPG